MTDFQDQLREHYTWESLKAKLDELAQAVKTTNVRITCKHCKRDGKYDVQVDNTRIQFDATKFIAEQGYGKAGQATTSTPAPVEGQNPATMNTADREALKQHLLSRRTTAPPA